MAVARAISRLRSARQDLVWSWLHDHPVSHAAARYFVSRAIRGDAPARLIRQAARSVVSQ
jgi:hypothetical protein